MKEALGRSVVGDGVGGGDGAGWMWMDGAGVDHGESEGG